ncbi:hypothetical protein HDU96_004128 [Phlyctochytrium bullatum]|nr:hypothetical protein HDU96_004128 [Phlyctochytrium bullatum]
MAVSPMTVLERHAVADDGTPIAFTINNPSGQGIPKVLVCGLSSLPVDWLAFPSELATEAPVVTVDNRGLGRSTKPDGSVVLEDISLERMAKDILTVLNEAFKLLDPAGQGRKKREFDLIGLSMGGFISQCLATLKEASPKIRKLVLLATAGMTPRSLLASEMGFKSGETKVDFYNRLMRLNTDESFKQRYPAVFEKLVQAAMDGKRPFQVIFAQLKATSKFNFLPELHKIDVPTLIVHGTRDDIIGFAYGEELAQHIPRAVMMKVHGAGHLVHAYPNLSLARTILNFLSHEDSADKSKL